MQQCAQGDGNDEDDGADGNGDDDRGGGRDGGGADVGCVDNVDNVDGGGGGSRLAGGELQAALVHGAHAELQRVMMVVVVVVVVVLPGQCLLRAVACG